MLLEADLPDDPDTLRAIVVEAWSEVASRDAALVLRDAQIVDLSIATSEADAEIARLTAIIAAFQRHRFGARSEQIDDDQLQLALEDLDAALGRVQAGLDAAAKGSGTARPRKANRGSLPTHLERIEQVVDIDDKTCTCCGGDLHVIGEDVAERLDVVPVTFRVLVTRRPRVACPGGGRGLPRVRGRTGPGTGTRAYRRGRLADRSADRARARQQIRRSSAIIPASPDLCPPRHPPRSFHTVRPSTSSGG